MKLIDTESFDLLGDWRGLGGDGLFGLGGEGSLLNDPCVVVLCLDLPLGLQSLDDVLVLPSDIVAQSSQGAELECGESILVKICRKNNRTNQEITKF